MQLEARLRAFAAVVRQGSFSRAASELFVSQPAVSKQVAALEAELGSELVVRGRRGITLTAPGRMLADYVLRAEALLANARRAVEAADTESGTVAVAASGIPGEYLLPGFLPAFFERHPRVSVEVRLVMSAQALQLVRAHEVELALFGGFTAPEDLEVEPLVRDDVVLVGPPSFASRRLRPQDLKQFRWVSREEGSATRAAVESAQWQLGLGSIDILELPSWQAVKAAVAAGGGIAAISRFAIEHELASGALVVLDVPRWHVERMISLAVARDVPLTPAAARFRAALREIELR
jgi:DNA-binding transcriptional LysR family regulator